LKLLLGLLVLVTYALIPLLELAHPLALIKTIHGCEMAKNRNTY